MRPRHWILGALVTAALPALAAEPATPDPAAVDLFVRKCGSCHTVGSGDRVGPDLKGALDRRGRPWVERFVSEPSAMLDSDAQARDLVARFKGVRMPDLGLSPAQVVTLTDLLGFCSTSPCDLQGKFVPVTQTTAADLARGRDLFVGRLALQNGAAPCLSCHAARGADAGVPGGTLAQALQPAGFDLTNAYARLGDEGLDAALKAPAFPVMGRVFEARPLNPDEALALRAFLYQANRAEPVPEEALSFPLVGGILAVIGLGLLNAVWSLRLRGVRSALVARPRQEKAP